MESFSNIKTFDKNVSDSDDLDNDLIKLFSFSSLSKWDRGIATKIPFIKITKVANDNGMYCFDYKGRDVLFSVLSDQNLPKLDKDTLKDRKKGKDFNDFRTLRFACSMDLVNPRVVVGNSTLGNLKLLIVFYENGIDKVIDYSNNLVMGKNDYYELFDFKEINVLDKVDLYNIYCILDKSDDYMHIYEYLIFTKEIFRELSGKEQFSFLKDGFDLCGINCRNKILFGDYNDCSYVLDSELLKTKYGEVQWELARFTKNPSEDNGKHITYDEKLCQYVFKENIFRHFRFDLLSNVIDDYKVQQQLLSDDRYRECHSNSIIIAGLFSKVYKDSVYIVGGKVKVNEVNYFYHSWVEIDNKNIVIDFNHNVVMDRDKYYEIYGAVVIEKTGFSEMYKLAKLMADINDYICPQQFSYFGKEMLNDFRKNTKIFQKN